MLAGQKIDATFNTDVSYSVQLPWDTTLAVTIQNVFNKDPEFSRDAINYDAFTGSPLGRTVRVGVRKRWGSGGPVSCGGDGLEGSALGGAPALLHGRSGREYRADLG